MTGRLKMQAYTIGKRKHWCGSQGENPLKAAPVMVYCIWMVAKTAASVVAIYSGTVGFLRRQFRAAPALPVTSK